MKKLLTLALISAAGWSASAQTLQDAIKLTDKEQYEKATAAFRQLLAVTPQSGEAWFYLGENYWQNERIDSAETCYKKGLEVNPRFPLNTVGIGKVLWGKGQKTEAQAAFDKAVSGVCDKANKFSKLEQAKVYREVGEAIAQGNNKDLPKALEFIAKALELDPKDAATYILKGDVLFDANPRDGSAPLENYTKAMNLDGLNAEPIARKAFMYYRAKNPSASLEEYTNAITLDPAFAPAYRGRAEANFMLRNYEAATADYDKYLSINQGSRSARVRYAKFLFLVKKYDEALKEISTLKQSGATEPTLKRIEAYTLTEKGDFASAKEVMTDYFVEQPAEGVIPSDFEYMGKIYTGLAAAADQKGTPADYDSLACEMCMKAARLDRSKDYLYVEAVKSYTKAKKYDKAIAAIREKIATGKTETNDYYYLGNAANKGKRWLTADSAWAMYIQRNPNAYQGYMYRARANAGLDSLENKSWLAKPYYEDMIRKMKPEEQEKGKADLEEAYNYLGLYYWLNKEAKDLPRTKCYFEKVRALNAGTSITKDVVEKYLITKDLKDLAPGTCELP